MWMRECLRTRMCNNRAGIIFLSQIVSIRDKRSFSRESRKTRLIRAKEITRVYLDYNKRNRNEPTNMLFYVEMTRIFYIISMHARTCMHICILFSFLPASFLYFYFFSLLFFLSFQIKIHEFNEKPPVFHRLIYIFKNREF